MMVEETKKGEDDKEETVSTDKTLNSMTPIWKKPKSEVTDEDYQDFYTDKFYDYEKPLKVIRSEVEGRTSYQTLLFIPSHAPYNYYSKDYEKGLQLYSKGVLIMDKCSDLLPDYFSFVKGLVDSEDISLNISRETLQENYQIQAIEKSLESKIKKELETMLTKDRENYEKFYKDFGMQLKYGIYSTYGMKKDLLQDLLLFNSSNDKKYTTLKEYVSRMKSDQKNIYYACSESLEKCEMLPQVDAVKEKGYEVLYLTEYLDEFTIKTLSMYADKTFMNVADEKLDLSTEEEKKELEEANTSYKDMLGKMKETLTDSVVDVTFTNHLKNHPVCLKTKGEVSTEMEKVLQSMPNNQNVKAETVMEINMNHPITKKMEELYNNKEINRELYFQGYIDTYISRDVRELTEIGNIDSFKKFIVSMASRTGEQLNYTSLANDAGISVPTAKAWTSILTSSGLVYLLEPYMSSELKRLTHVPKIIFMDTGLASYLAGWESAKELQLSSNAGHYLETFVISEIVKSYNAKGIRPNLSYYRDKEKNEIDLIVYKNNKLYPFEIKKTASPTKEMIKHFKCLEKTSKEVGTGGIICCYDVLMHLDEKNYIIPISSVVNAKE